MCVFLITIGCLCRHVCRKPKPLLVESVSPPEEKPAPFYYDILDLPQQPEQGVELDTNLAYDVEP